MSLKLPENHGIMNLPEDVLTEILVKFPVEFLVRLSCVCKAWHDLIIRKPFFGGKHFDNNRFPTLIFSWGSTKESAVTEDLLSFSENNNCLLHSSRPDLSSGSLSHRNITGSCNGIVCLEEYRNSQRRRSVHLYNPITREDLQLPRGNLVHKYYSLGLGLDASSKDYKVVAIGGGRIHAKKHIEIYKLSTNCWSRLRVNLKHGYIIQDNGVFVNGFYHWWTTTEGKILTFDFRNEIFGTIKLPDRPVYGYCMGVLDDSLAVCDSRWPPGERGYVIDVWVITKQGTWMKKFSAKVPDWFSLHALWPVHDTNQLVLLGRSLQEQLAVCLVEAGDTKLIKTGRLFKGVGVPFQPTLIFLARD